MSATLRAHVASRPAAAPPSGLSAIRLAALDCRAAPRGVARVSQRNAGLEDCAAALAAMLPLAMFRRPVFWAPGTAAQSFDERWLMAVIDAARTDDRDSLRFLLTRRVRPEARDVLRRMVEGLANALDRT